MGRRKPKRLKTGDEPNGEVVKVKVRVKVESDDNKEEESSDNDDKEEVGEQVAQPVAQVKRLAYVEQRPDYILMDYNKSIRPINCWCYTKLDPVYWGENRIDRCPTYGVCQGCCGSGPTGKRCLIYCNNNVIYVCMLIILKDDMGEEITRMVDAQWILHIFEAAHIHAQANRVQVEHCIDPWGCATMEWVENRMKEKHQDMKANGKMIATYDKIKSRAVRTVRLIQRGLLEEEKSGDYDFTLNQAKVLDWEKYKHYKE
jgi:hypothetical protein